MKYLKLYLYLLIIVAIIFGCSSGNKEAEVKPLTSKIKGELANYLEIVDDSYKIVKSNQSGMNWEITFKLKLIENPIPPTLEAINNNTIELDIKLSITDESGKPINGINTFWMADGLINNSSELEKLKSLLEEKIGTEEWFTLATDADYNSDYEEKLPESISKFIIRTETKQSQNEPRSNQSLILDSPNDDEENADISESSDCNVELTEYEEFVDEYIEFAEKASEGDYSVMAEAPSLMQKAESAGRNIQNMGQAKLGLTCWDKYLRIQKKLSEAALRISKNLPKNMNNMQKQLNDLQNSIPH